MSMDIEHDVKAVPIDENYAAELKKWEAEGWQIAPGAKPMAIYHLVRQKKSPGLAGVGGMGELQLDDSKIMVLKKDGTLQ